MEGVTGIISAREMQWIVIKTLRIAFATSESCFGLASRSISFVFV
jgi:hypothetical protein